MKSQFLLFAKRKFLPLFLTQFLGAFNDNVFKNALVILITYYAAEKAGLNAQLLVTLAAGIFILPFFLFSATAGQLSDKHEKSRMIRIIKFTEVLLMATAAMGFYLENVWLLMFVLFLMGTQSSFFGPLKYSILPDHLNENELIGGNALIEAGTFLSILLGTIIGGLAILAEGGIAYISTTIIAVSALGWVASFFIPHAKPAAPNLHVNFNIFKETWDIIKYSRKEETVFLSIIGISWFWLVGATFLAQFPTYAKDIIGGNEEIVTLFLTVFSIGIGLGSLICNKLLKGEISGKFVPAGAIGMAIFTVTLYLASNGQAASESSSLIGFSEFINIPKNWFIIFSLLMIAISGGIYIVPLYAIMQSRSEESHRARTIAANNVMNALFMVLSAIGTVGMLSLDFSVTDVFLTLAVINIPVAIFVRKLVKHQIRKREQI